MRGKKGDLQTELQSLTETLQPILGLSDWTIEVRVVRRNDLPKEGIEGCLQTYETDRSARISIIDPCDQTAINQVFPPTPSELILLHELVHLVFWFEPALDDTPPLLRSLHEQSIQSLAQALYTLGGGDPATQPDPPSARTREVKTSKRKGSPR